MRSQLLTQLLPLLSPSSPLKRRTSYSSSPCPFFTETTVQAFETYITADTKTPSYVVFLLPQLNGADGPTFLCNRSLTSMPHEPVTTVQLSQSIPCTEVPQTLGAPSSGVEVEFMYVGDRLTLTETVPCRNSSIMSSGAVPVDLSCYTDPDQNGLPGTLCCLGNCQAQQNFTVSLGDGGIIPPANQTQTPPPSGLPKA